MYLTIYKYHVNCGSRKNIVIFYSILLSQRAALYILQSFKSVSVTCNVMVIYFKEIKKPFLVTTENSNILHAKAVQFSNLPISRTWCSGTLYATRPELFTSLGHLSFCLIHNKTRFLHHLKIF